MAKPNPRVGVRELRQNLSVYLRLVKRGETLEVTERGKLVARLAPSPPADWFEQMVAKGKIIPAERDIRELGPPLPPRPGEKPLSEVLEEMRDEERF